MSLLSIKGLHVSVAGKEIIRGIDLEIEEGRTAVIFGPNGSGKSTLMGAIAGLPGYDVTEGSIEFKGRELKNLSTDDRARLGIGLSYQYPPVVKGVRLRTLLESMASERDIIPLYANMLNLTNYLDRDINLGFSGGERKRSEVLQLMVQTPDLMLLDEPESGVDIENISIIADALKYLLEKDKPITKRTRSALIITHTGFILDYIRADVAHVIMNGRVLGCGSPSEIFEEIRLNGYSKCTSCFAEQFKGNNIC